MCVECLPEMGLEYVPAEVANGRVMSALSLAFQYSQIDGSHHKMWVIDQMVRALTGDDYQAFVEAYQEPEDDDGEMMYEWDEGIAP